MQYIQILLYDHLSITDTSQLRSPWDTPKYLHVAVKYRK